MPNLYIMIGMPRSGKSTFANQWSKLSPMRVVISSDNIRTSLHGKNYEKLSETMVFAIKHVMIRAMLERGYDVLVDGTHSTKISIQRLLEIDKNAKFICMRTSIEECIRRAQKCNRPDLIPVIHRIDSNLKKLGLVNGKAGKRFLRHINQIKSKIDSRGLF